MENFKALFVGFFLLLLSCGLTSSSHCDYTTIYNFGDSNSATGGFSIRKPKPPNAHDRFCDGHLIIDFIAEKMKLPYLNAYVNSVLEADFHNGANFARAGSSIRKTNPKAKNESERAKFPRPENFSKALYTFDIGQNDLTKREILLGSLDQIRPIITEIIDHLASSIKNIYQQDHGGRSFWIHNTGPVGCLPFYIIPNRSSTIHDNVGCVKSYNEIALEFNKQLQEKINTLKTELMEAAIKYVDIYAAKYALISNAKNLGFDDPFEYCCGGDKQNPVAVLCGETNNKTHIFGGGCPNPSKFVSWDNIHYTQAANTWVFNQIVVDVC
ncbi:GDSL esterase/lipase [Melia azedarach]|uniref:GDSL esterase/lipase n=1 Tax=Melia azedarach TaxID=155640 RepID=A0ACC1YD02_MELAZ|nr:GDSL esterase/lipase [Melia azedarach]